LKKVPAPAERNLPTAAEIEEAKKRAEVEPEAPPKELLPKVGDGRTHLDLISEGGAKLKPVPEPKERYIPTAQELEDARKRAEVEPEPVPKELLPKVGDGRTHLDLITEGAAQLKKTPAPAERPVPTAQELEEARKRAEIEPEPVPRELLPKVGDGRTHLDLITEGAAQLKKVRGPGERRVPTAQELEEARKLAEIEPEPVPRELQPKVGDGRTHLDLITEGAAQLKKVPAPPERPLPTPEQLEAAKKEST
jgi:broad specificity phosphatase PhoE